MSPAGLRRRITVSWVLTRAVLVSLALLPAEAADLADVRTFHTWSVGFWRYGVVPGRDFAWEYPHGAAPFLLLPVGDGGPWATFAVLALAMLAVDLLMLVLLLRRAARAGSHLGPLVWLVGPMLLGPVALTRFDLVPGVLAAIALVAGPVAAGALLVCAATTKLWPAVLLVLLLVRSRRRREVLAGAAAALVLSTAAAAATGVLPAAWTAVRHQLQRGVQVESLAALAPLWAGHPVVYRHGAWEVASSLADVTAWGLMAVCALALLSLLRAARRGSGDLLLLATEAVGWLLLTDKVLSPQYLLWLLPFLALAACRPHGLPASALALGAASLLLTHLVYPLRYDELLQHDPLTLVLLTARDLALVGLVVELRRARRAREAALSGGADITTRVAPAPAPAPASVTP
ncbi:MAG: glycosyltransferase 87 family protein [Mycobacteriales bacterium]